MYVLRKGALPFAVVRDTLRALRACDDDWLHSRWAPPSTQVRDIATLLNDDEPEQIAQVLTEWWFEQIGRTNGGGGGVDTENEDFILCTQQRTKKGMTTE